MLRSLCFAVVLHCSTICAKGTIACSGINSTTVNTWHATHIFQHITSVYEHITQVMQIMQVMHIMHVMQVMHVMYIVHHASLQGVKATGA